MRSPIHMSVQFSAGLAAAVASMCFGASVVATRFVVAETQPVSLAFLRYVIACVLLSPVMWRVLRTSIPRRDMLAIAVLGVLFFGIFPWTFSASLTHSTSSRVAIELATMPLITLLISRWRGYDRITRRTVMGQLLAFAGLVIALRPAASGTADLQSTHLAGDMLAGVTALIGAIYNVFSRRYLKQYPPLHVSTLAMYAGVLFLAPLAMLQGVLVQPAFSRNGWIALIFLGSLGGAFAFSLWTWALQRSTPSRVSVFIGLNPLTAMTLGVLLLHESVTIAFVVGLVLVIAGIVLANRTSTPVLAQQPEMR